MNETFFILITAISMGFIAWWIATKAHSKKTVTRGMGSKRTWGLNLARGIGSNVFWLLPDQWLSFARNKEDLLIKAGLAPQWGDEEYLGYLVLGASFGYFLGAFFLFPGEPVKILLSVLGGVWYIRSSVNKQKEKRQFELVKEFPTAIDMIVLGIEGGLDISAGIKEMIDNSDDSILREEFVKIYADISVGESRARALRKFSERVEAIEIRSVILSMVQAIEMGSEIGPLMRMQAEQLRFNRLTRAEEAANKAPVKMMIPMVFFILPCMFLVIFAPIAVSFMQTIRGIF